MATRIEELQENNEHIYHRYERASKVNDVTEMYAARKDYQDNIDKQKEELNKMDKNSPEYSKAKASVEQQQSHAYGMRYHSQTGNDMSELQSHMKNAENENDHISRQMDDAIAKGNTAKYDQLRQRYDTNIKAQEAMSSQLKYNGIEHEDTTYRQKQTQLDKDISMRNKLGEKVAQKGDKANKKDLADLEKYKKNVNNDERKLLEEQDKKKLDKMESYGVSQEAIEKERQNQERERNRYLGETHSR